MQGHAEHTEASAQATTTHNVQAVLQPQCKPCFSYSASRASATVQAVLQLQCMPCFSHSASRASATVQAVLQPLCKPCFSYSASRASATVQAVLQPIDATTFAHRHPGYVDCCTAVLVSCGRNCSDVRDTPQASCGACWLGACNIAQTATLHRLGSSLCTNHHPFACKRAAAPVLIQADQPLGIQCNRGLLRHAHW